MSAATNGSFHDDLTASLEASLAIAADRAFLQGMARRQVRERAAVRAREGRIVQAYWRGVALAAKEEAGR